MAELLIKAVDAFNPDPTKDRRGCYKKGDVVCVRPDGWEWGKEERTKRFSILRIPCSDYREFSYLANPFVQDDPCNPLKSRRRLHSLRNYGEYSLGLGAALTCGAIPISWNSLKKSITDARRDSCTERESYLSRRTLLKLAALAALYMATPKNLTAAPVIKTVKPSGGDYTSLANWEAGRQADLTSASPEFAECYSMEDTTGFKIDGWTTTADNYIHIYGAASDKTSSNTGKWSTARYRLVASGYVINITEEFVRISNIQISVGTIAAGIYVSCGGSNGGWYISGNVIKTHSDGPTHGINVVNVGTGMNIWNNIVYNFTGAASYGIYDNVSSSANYLNNTVYNCTTGYWIQYGSPVVKNNLAQDCGTCFSTDGLGSASNNCSDDNTQPGTSGRNGEVAFADEENADFHLDASDTVALDYGVSDPGSGLFSTDIDGQTRSGTWDIGADEYVATESSPRRRTLLGVGR